MKSKACVTVIIPCYKCSETIERAITSILKQTLQPKEVILVNDASPDNTLEKLKEIQLNHPKGWIKIVSLPKNSGPGSARNLGWEISSQPYIAFLDSDDSWHPQKIEIQYNTMLQNKEIAMTADAYKIISSKDHLECEIKKEGEPSTSQIKKNNILFSNKISTPCVMLKKDIPFRFRANKKYSEDYLLWCEIILSGYTCLKIDSQLTYLYKAAYGESGLSSNLLLMGTGELDSIRKLYQSSKIGLATYIISSAWSAIKLTRRMARSLITK